MYWTRPFKLRGRMIKGVVGRSVVVQHVVPHSSTRKISKCGTILGKFGAVVSVWVVGMYVDHRALL